MFNFLVFIVNEGQPSIILISAEYLTVKTEIEHKYFTLENIC